MSRDPAGEGFTRYIIGKHIDENRPRVESWGDVGDPDFGPRIRTIFLPGDVICTTRGPKLKVATVDFRGLGAHTNFVLRTRDPEVLLQSYLESIVRSAAFQQHLAKHFRGSVNLFVNWSDAALYELDLPPIEEQDRASRVLSNTSTLTEVLADMATAAGVLRCSYLDHMCDLPAGVGGVRLDAVCRMQNGKAFSGSEYCEQGVRLLRPGNLSSDGSLVWNSSKTTHLPLSWMDDASGHVVKPGDVLINLTAQSLEDGFMGRVCMAGDGDVCLLNQRIGRFFIDNDKLLPEFLFRCLQTTRFKVHAIANCEGSKVKHMFWGHLAKFEIPLPSMGEQARVVEQLRMIDTSCLHIAARQTDARNLNNYLLAQMV